MRCRDYLCIKSISGYDNIRSITQRVKPFDFNNLPDEPQNVTVSQTSVTVIENEAILVTCSANAVPSPSFNWLKGSVEYQDGAYLNITSAAPKDSGTYTCKANNTKGETGVSVIVDVQCKYYNQLIQL